jgi:hypothetical protein
MVIAISGFLIPISLVSCLMIAVRSYGTSTVDPLGWLTVVACPPVSLVAGIGLLRRRQWARFYMLALLFAALAFNGYKVLRGPIPERSYISPSGVRTTVLASSPTYSVPAVTISICLLAMLLSRRVRSEFSPSGK